MPRRSTSPARPRNAEATKQRLVASVDRLIERDGFAAVGVNAVAKEAGVDKALIYRYFDGFSGLLDAYAESGSFWPSTSELIGDAAEFAALSLPERLARVLERYVDALRKRPRTLEILAWEVVERNEVTIRLEEIRERRGLELMRLLVRGVATEVDVQALVTVFAGAVHYLLLRARHVRRFNGIDLQSDAGWRRMIDAAADILTHGIRVR